MYRKVADFLKSYEYETAATIKTLGALSDESLSQSVCNEHRTLGRIAWHTVTTITEMMSQTGLSLPAVDKDAPVPKTAAEIVEGYKRASSELATKVEAEWTDESLLTEDNMYGETWVKGQTLAVLVHHEIHHRGQMTILMRQAGLKVPGIYGPSMEEWAAFGAPVPSV